jgi:UDP-glucose 4-epimerase
MRILVTGCHGFIGASFGRFAQRAGHEIFGVSRQPKAESAWYSGYRQADVSKDDLAPLIRDFRPEIFLHAAGAASVAGSLANPMRDLRDAVLTWANALDGLRRSAERPFVIFPSSAAVYGNPVAFPVTESAALEPISPYGFHKLSAELVAREYATCFGIDILVARLFSVYGPLQRRLLLWELFTEATGASSEILVKGTGKEARDYLHIDDVSAYLLQLAGTQTGGVSVLNVAAGTETRVADLAQLVGEIAGRRKPVRALGQVRSGDPVRWRADVSRLRASCVRIDRPLAEGVRECVEAWRK